jgi:hypothetical protein
VEVILSRGTAVRQDASRKTGRPKQAVAALRGTWRLIETELWDVEDLDLVESAHLTLGPGGLGELQLIAIGAGIDYRISEREGIPFVEFSWAGWRVTTRPIQLAS